MLTIGSLFSGIGGLELGLERAGLGPTIWQVEKDMWCRAVLARHWPDAERFDDVCTVGAAQLVRPDLVCGGFPCQDVSSAGRRAGLTGSRSVLWYEFARLIEELCPRCVVIENVASGAKRWVDAVRGDLGRLGYASLPIPIAASDCGAPHARARVFIVGITADSHSQQRLAAEIAPATNADCHVLREQPRRFGWPCQPGQEGQSKALSANPDSSRKPQPRRCEREVGRWSCDTDRIWTDEPYVARVVHGLSGRVDRERALGNSVVPQCAEVVGHVIARLLRTATVANP